MQLFNGLLWSLPPGSAHRLNFRQDMVKRGSYSDGHNTLDPLTSKRSISLISGMLWSNSNTRAGCNSSVAGNSTSFAIVALQLIYFAAFVWLNCRKRCSPFATTTFLHCRGQKWSNLGVCATRRQGAAIGPHQKPPATGQRGSPCRAKSSPCEASPTLFGGCVPPSEDWHLRRTQSKCWLSHLFPWCTPKETVMLSAQSPALYPA